MMKPKPFYIEIDASGVGLAVAMPQTRGNTSCPRDKVPHNSTLRLFAFASKSLTGPEKGYSNIWPQDISPLLICEIGEYDYRSQTSSYTIRLQ